MVISVFDVANYFLYKSAPGTLNAVTHLKLQKLAYYAQAWHYTILRKPLFNEEIEAWVHGPVCPVLYNEFRDYGYEVIPVPRKRVMADLHSIMKHHPEVEALLEFVWDLYGKHTGKELEDLTHREDPWKRARKNISESEPSNNIITLDSMRKYYKKFLTGVK
ncbi:Panacea domain-containing protein [Brevibacillus sp. SIMBA_040]|uniref:Panacea domain-containing protein n=1 Tax=unclassified Brevibacillus TaxID=2684853 RepID=UPI003979E88C